MWDRSFCFSVLFIIKSLIYAIIVSTSYERLSSFLIYCSSSHSILLFLVNHETRWALQYTSATRKNANLSQSGNGKSIVCCFTDFVLTARICQEDIILMFINGNFETQVVQTCKLWARFSIARIRQYIIMCIFECMKMQHTI